MGATRRVVIVITLAGSLALSEGSLVGQQPGPAVPVVEISGPTVVAFWRSPTTNEDLARDPDLAAALDEQQYYWAETCERLAALGITALGQPGYEFRLQDGRDDRLFRARPDSAAIGYLLVEPGREYRALYRLRYPDELIAEARLFFGSNDGR